MTASPEWLELSNKLEKALSGNVRQLPSAHTFFLCAVEGNFSPSQEVVLVAKRQDPLLLEMVRKIGDSFLPHTVTIFKPLDEPADALERLVPFVQQLDAIEGKPAAYVCRNYTCAMPATDPDRMMEIICGSEASEHGKNP